MGQYQIFVGADTKSATTSLNALDKVVKGVTKARELKITFPNTKTFEKNIRNATKYASNGVKTLINNVDGLKDAYKNVSTVANPRSFLSGSFAGANVGAQTLLDKLAKISIALYGLNSAAGILKGTFGSLFAQTIGQANAFEEQLLKTKTTLASTSDVFIDGKKITDPLEAIKGLTGVIDERIESIRLRTIDIAGVTSGEVVEVFSIVASQAGQIGASLEDAENLAISFAAALGTFGLPLRQARQEITSILQGNVNVDSYLAQALQIKNEDIQKARSQVGGIAKFLEDRLSTAVAGQAIAAKTLGGVLSNVRDIWEEFGRALGTPLLEPLVAAVGVFYETLGDSLAVIKSIGAEVGKVLAIMGRGAAAAAGFGGFDQSQLQAIQQGMAQLLKSAQSAFQSLNANLLGLFAKIEGQLGAIFGNIAAQVAMIGEAFGELGRAVLVLTGAQIESFVGAIAQLIPILTGAIAGVTGLIKVWADFLKLPIVQTFVRFQTTLKVLEATGVKAIVMMTAKLVLFKGAIIATVKSVWSGVRSVLKGIGVVLKALAGLTLAVTRLMRQLAVLGVKLGVISRKAALDIKKMTMEMNGLAVSAKTTGASLGTLAKGVWTVAGAFKGLLRTTLILAAIELALVGIVEGISLWQRQQAEAAKDRELQNAIDTLDRTAEAAAKGGLSSLDEKLREIANRKVTDQIDQLAEEIASLDEKLKELEERRNSNDVFIDYSLDTDLEQTQEKRKKAAKELAELQQKLNKDTAKKDVEARAKAGKKLEKELAEFRKKLADDEFRYRQRLASAELDRFRAQSALELQRMERVLKMRLEGEEGASRVFLENLGKYLSEKKRGEDQIAARQKQLQITLANLQKEIADYKYNTEKKIAELQKKMGKFQMEVADYKLKKMQEEAKASSDGQYAGNFGNDAIGKLTAAIVSKESGGNYNAINPDSGAIGIGQVMPENVPSWTLKHYGESLTPDQFKNNPTAQNAVVRGQIKDNYMTQKGQGYSDEEAARRVAATWYSGNPDLHTSTRKQTSNGNEYPSISEYADDVVSRMGTSGGPAQKPDSPVLDLEAVDVSKVTSSLESLKKVLGDIKALQDEMTNEGIAAAFQDITQGMFGTIQLEPLQDALKNADALFAATADSAQRVTDAQKAQIAYQTEINRVEAERSQAIQLATNDSELSEERRAQLIENINTEADKYLDNLREQKTLKDDILATTQATLAIEKMRAEALALEESTADNMLRMRLEMEGITDTEIEGEIRKARAAREYGKAIEAAQAANNPEQAAKLRAEYERLATAIDKSTKVQLQMRDPLRQLFTQWKADLKNVNAMYAAMVQTVQSELASAMSNAITGVIDGTMTVKEAMANMFKNIGKAFIDMATQMIAKAIVMKALGIFLPGLGGGFNMGTTPLGAGGGSVGGIGTLGPNFGFQVGAAQGAYVNSATPALIGEGGVPEYVIPENKMESSMKRFAQGIRGDGVVKGADSSFSSQNRSQAQPTALGDVSRRYSPGNNYSSTNNFGASGSASDNYSINLTGEQLVFNEKNYISQDEIPNIISQASMQGEARTLRKLRMSQGTRQKIGI